MWIRPLYVDLQSSISNMFVLLLLFWYIARELTLISSVYIVLSTVATDGNWQLWSRKNIRLYIHTRSVNLKSFYLLTSIFSFMIKKLSWFRCVINLTDFAFTLESQTYWKGNEMCAVLISIRTNLTKSQQTKTLSGGSSTCLIWWYFIN